MPGARAIAPLLAAVLVLGPSCAAAHEIVPGVSGLASAILHPFVTAEIVLVMVALALLVGAEGWSRALALCAPIIATGAAIGLRLQTALLALPALWMWPMVWAGLLGLLLASGLRIGRWPTLGLAFVSAVTVGLGVPRERPFLSGAIEAWGGATLAMLILAVALALPWAAFESALARSARRVAGAWIAAIAALGLAAALR